MGSPVLLPNIDPNQPIYGYPYGPYGGQGGSQLSSMGFNVSGPYVNVNPNSAMEDIFAQNRNLIGTEGNVIAGEAGNQLPYYGGIQASYQNAQNQALNALGQQPGYTPDQAAQIGYDYSQFNTPQSAFNQQFLTPEEQQGISGDPNAPLSGLSSGIGAEGAFLNEYQQNLGAQLGQYGANLGSGVNQFAQGVGGAANGALGGISGALGSYQSGLQGALGGEQSGVTGAIGDLSAQLGAAQGKFSSLDQAVNNPALGFDPGGTEKQLTDQDVQDIRTQAGLSVGNTFRTAEDTLERQAAMAGNTSPAALAAMRQNLVTQEGATAGDAEAQAQIAALQAQYQRAAGIEAQREGAVQTQQGMRATAATTEEAAAQAAAGLAGQAGLSGQEFLGSQRVGAMGSLGQAGLQGSEFGGSLNLGAQSQIGSNQMNAINQLGAANLGAVNAFGNASLGQANTMTGQLYSGQSTAEQLAAQRAALLGQNRQQTQTGINQAQYQQGTGSQQLTAAGQQNVGQTAIQGMNNYRSGLAGQQSLSQQGGQAAQQTQLGAYGTQTSGLNSSASSQGNFEVGKPSLGDQLGKSLAGLFAEGGIASEPTLAKLGEKGPEMVIPLGPYKSRRSDMYSDEEAA